MFADRSNRSKVSTKLSQLRVGDSAVLISLPNDTNIKKRLMDLGLSPGIKIKCVACAPCGAPSAYRVRSTIMALRECDADMITIKEFDEKI